MRVFIVTQKSFVDGGFGDCVRSNDKVIGVFTTKVKAEKHIDSLKPFKIQKFQFGSGTKSCEIVSKTLK